MDIIVGTAGHIDHGKTALVRMLTGTDTDRLPEEKQRGITIDLGFAELELGDIRFGFVDVPGHERFVKNMLAGASGIDLVLLVIAADEGIMPQTREHFDICRLLKIRKGIIALTKRDLVDDEVLEIVRAEAAELVRGTFLEDAPVVTISSRTGEGVEVLKGALVTTSRSVPERADGLIARLPIDRSFSMKGFGTVVTGTLASGKLAEGEELELLPAEKKVRVRGLQTHGKKVTEATAGRRTAVNLAGIDHFEVQRGMLLTEPGILRPAQIFDAEIEVLADAARPIRTRQRVRVHIGTAEVLARVFVIDEPRQMHPGESGFVQLRLESPVAAIASERFILRSYSPQLTIAGGAILRPAREKLRRREATGYRGFLRAVSAAAGDNPETLRLLVRNSGERGLDTSDVRSITGWRRDVLETASSVLLSRRQIIANEGVFLAIEKFDELKERIVAETERFHQVEPLARGLALEALRESAFKLVPTQIERAVLSDLASEVKLVIDRETVRLPAFGAKFSKAEGEALDRLRSIYVNAGLEAPKLDEALAEASRTGEIGAPDIRKLFQTLLDSGEVVPVSGEFYFASFALEELIAGVRRFAENSPDRLIDVATFKQLAGVSRKFAIPLLEHFDRRKITVRHGDKRLII